ncbi:carbohydrate ABC transporter permease [Numidum massiliense]|uniref:carbohydrate ABC transporter permease n=1 Tax=Numidum massiliense TaxID=1522315 RepID=UPI0006D56F20|nr:carbohydrate ABC transporter permease [Numidum massiliense]
MSKNGTGKKITLYVVTTFLALIFLLPFIVMVSGSLQKIQYMMADPMFWWPKEATLDNFHYIFFRAPFFRWFLNSSLITIIPVITDVFLCTILGYIFAKKKFFGREVIFWTMMAMVMIPSQLFIIPRYIMFSKFGWINTYYPMIIPQLWGIMGVFLVKQFMQTIPKELEEAAYMDGASDGQIFFKIIAPISKPVMATVGTFAFIGNWNELLAPLIYTTQEKMYPLTVGLASLLTREGNFGIEMSGAVVSFIPTFLVFIFFQRYFTQGIALTGLK